MKTVRDFYKTPTRVDGVFVHRNQDNRPYIYVDLLRERVLALLDSGANQSILGRNCLYLIKKLGLELIRPVELLALQTADGADQSILGHVRVSLSLEGRTNDMNLLVSDSITNGLTLGSDFCYLFGIRPNFEKDSFVVPLSVNSLNVIHTRSDLDLYQNRELEAVISKFKEISGPSLGRINTVQHSINTGDAEPVKQRYFPMSPVMLEAVNAEVDQMLELGVIRPSSSPWNSPVVIVKKKDGKLRFCFDGRRLNSVTKRDAYPLPYVSDILDRLRDGRFLSSIDLKYAFWQIPLSPESCEKTAFTVPRRGLYEFTVLPFGLHNSPQTLQRLMDKIFGPKFDNVFVYLDDIIIVSSNFKEHVETLNEVHKRLRNAGLTINIDKCEFCKSSLTYLGYVIDQAGLRTDPQKVMAITNFPTPRTSTEIKRLLGMCGWYRRFIPDFSTVVAPILDLVKGTHKRQQIKWTNEAEKAFQVLKGLLVSAPILASPDFSKEFLIQTDASDVGVGAVLLQGEGDEERVVAYASRSLGRAERSYSATEKECLAVLFGIEKYRPYIEGAKFKVITDHHSLLWLNRLQSPTGRVARWSVKLAQHSFDIVHRKGKFNVVPDALSRAPLKISSLGIQVAELENWYTKMISRVAKEPERFPAWMVQDGLLYKYVPNKHNVISNLVEWKIVVPKISRATVIRQFHEEPTAGHFGYFKTWSRICEQHYWPGMKCDIMRFVKKCPVCLGSKSSTQSRPGLMGQEKSIRFPFQLISVDLMGPFPRSSKGNTSLLVVSDWFTKFVLLQPLRKATASSVARFLEEQVFLVYGVPQIIMCDNGRQFTGREFKKLTDSYKVQKIWYNALYHAQVNPVERVNRVIGTAIRSFVNGNHRSWDEQVHKIGFAIRTAVHEVTGFSPSFLNFGRTVPLSGDYYGSLDAIDPSEITLDTREQLVMDVNKLSELQVEVTKRLHSAYQKNQTRYNFRKRTLTFVKGDVVWKKNYVLSSAADNFSQKLAPKYVRCTVKEVTGPLTYRLSDERGRNIGVWHVKDLK